MMKIIKNLIFRGIRRLKYTMRQTYWTPKRIHKSGIRLVEKINRKRQDNSVIAYTGPFMGDTLYMMAFVEEFHRIHPDKRVIVLTFSSFAKSLVETYTGYEQIVLLTKHQSRMFEMLSYDFEVAQFARENAVFNVQGDEAYSTEYPTVMDRLRHLFFEVGDNAPIHYHQLPPAKVTSIDDFYENAERIVVLNPYSNSMHLPREQFSVLEDLVRHLKTVGGGYTVYTNVIKDQLPICGTKELRCGLPELLEIASHIPFIISVRSGVLDFLAKTDVNMFVIYPNKGIQPQVYSLKDWQCNGIVKEVTCEEFLSDHSFEKIDEFLKEIDSEMETESSADKR